MLGKRNMKKQLHLYRWIVWGLAVAFYFYEYFIRVAPSVMVDDLFHSFNIGAGVFGLISAAYFYAYAPMQLPVGIMMDRYGARKLLTIATLICGFATLLFGVSLKVWVAIIARFLMGGGSAFAFLGMVYISSHWFHGKILARLVGIGNSLGMLGAVGGEGPLAIIVHTYTWRSTVISLGIIGVLLGIAILFFVRNEPPSVKHHDTKPKTSLLKSMKLACKNSQTWINGIVAMMFYTATTAFGGLWAIPFLQQTQGFSNAEASFAASMIYMGWIAAGPFIGYVSDKICNRKVLISSLCFLSIIFFCLVVYSPISAPIWIFILMFLLGVCLSGQLLCYSLAIELNTHEIKGAALAMTNFLVFVAGSAMQTSVGFFLDTKWTGGISHHIRVYSLENYQFALALFPLTMALAFIFNFFIKEKKKPWCKKRSAL